MSKRKLVRDMALRVLVVVVLFGGFFVQVGVAPALALGIPQIVSINPPSPAQVGTSVTIRARVDWDSDFRCMRLRFGNEGWQESCEIEYERTFSTGHLSAGWYTIRVEVARQGDNSWSNPTVAEASYQLTATYTPPTATPQQSISCQVTALDAWPGSPRAQGMDVTIAASGSCNTGVRAMRVKIDGGILYEIGAPSLNTTWHTSGYSTGWHTIRVEVAGWGDDSWSQAGSASLNFELTSPPQQQPTQAPSPSSYFATGDVIQIGYDIFVMVNGERRHVPNPETLDALGIPRSWINNRGLSDWELGQIPRGSDIPDVLRDPGGFQSFKNWIFPNTAPIVPATVTPRPQSDGQQTGSFSFSVSPTSVAPGGTVTVRWSGYNPDGNDWISMHPAGRPDSEYLDWQYARGSSGSLTFTAPSQPGWYDFRMFRNGPKYATSERFQVVAGQAAPAPSNLGGESASFECEEAYGRQGIVREALAARPPGSLDIHQCTGYVANIRRDAYDWLPPSGADAKYWPGWARDAGLWVHSGSEAAPSPGELVVWQPGCGPAPSRIEVNGQWVSGPGHVAVVSSVHGNEITVREANVPWGSPPTSDHRYQILDGSCMSFIGEPGASVSVPEPSTVQTLWSRLVLWVKNLFGW